MTEDTRKAANADARAFGDLAFATTNLNVAQMWQQQSLREGWETGFSKEDYENALDKVSRPQTPEKS